MRTYVSDKQVRIEERLHFIDSIKFKATIDREKNTIRISSTYVKKFRIYLHDSMLDLDKPIRVLVNGRQRARKKVKRSVKVLLESALRDREQLYTATLDIRVR